jgi:cytochrome c553
MASTRRESQHATMWKPLKDWILLVAAAAPLVCQAQSTATLNMLQRALALTPDLQNGEHLYLQYCAACHQRSGWGNGPREVPALAGQQESYLLEQLLRFSNLERKKIEMHAVVTKPQVESPQSIRDVTAYIASRPRNPGPDHGDGTQLHVGEQVYARSCMICHEKDGAGNRDDLIPAIGGQQYGYLLVRLGNFAREPAAVEHGSMEPAVVNLLVGLSSTELKAVADYTSRLTALRAH